MVEYEDTLYHYVVIGFFVLYFIFNFPLSKLLVQRRIRNKLLRCGCSEKNPWDQCYCLLHSTLHDDWGPLECQPLIQGGNGHLMNSPICWKMQWEYYRSDPSTKQRIINEIHPNPKSQIIVGIAAGFDFLFSVISLLYPIFWCSFMWYEHSGRFHFIWILGSCYSVVLSMSIITCFRNLCNEPSANWFVKINTAIFLWSLPERTISEEEVTKTLLEQMPTVGVVLESESLHFNSALIVLGYLFGSAPSI